MYRPETGEGGKSTSHISGGYVDHSDATEEPESMDLSNRPKPGSSDVESPAESSPVVETKNATEVSDSSESERSWFRDWKLPLEVAGLRLQSTTRTLIRLAGIVLVLLAAYNALLVPAYGAPAVAFYRITETPVWTQTGTYVYVEDVAAALFGAAVAWFV